MNNELFTPTLTKVSVEYDKKNIELCNRFFLVMFNVADGISFTF